MTTEKVITVRVPSNIALIKYWGKKCETYHIPLNDSVSLTIDDLYAETTVRCGCQGEADSVTINGEIVNLKTSTRFHKCFEEIRRLLRKSKIDKNGDIIHPAYSFHVTSTTNFPVGAGLASSAAGFAAIAYAIGEIFSLEKTTISRIARLGSGSACRSISDGLVHWKAGSDSTGLDSFAETIIPSSHWPSLRALVLVLDSAEKKIGSSVGMQRTAGTSELIKYRAEHVVPIRIKRIFEAFENRNFAEFAKIIMMDSNQFHAVCLDSYPPIKYMNNDSWRVIEVIHKFNRDNVRAAYTFDAGPNACIFTTEDNMEELLDMIKLNFIVECLTIDGKSQPQNITTSSNDVPRIANIIQSKVGNGPQVIGTE